MIAFCWKLSLQYIFSIFRDITRGGNNDPRWVLIKTAQHIKVASSVGNPSISFQPVQSKEMIKSDIMATYFHRLYSFIKMHFKKKHISDIFHVLQELCSLDFLVSSQINLDAVSLLRQRRRGFKTCNVSALIISRLNVIMVCNSVMLLLTFLSCFVFPFPFPCFILSQFDVRRHFPGSHYPWQPLFKGVYSC